VSNIESYTKMKSLNLKSLIFLVVTATVLVSVICFADERGVDNKSWLGGESSYFFSANKPTVINNGDINSCELIMTIRENRESPIIALKKQAQRRIVEDIPKYLVSAVNFIFVDSNYEDFLIENIGYSVDIFPGRDEFISKETKVNINDSGVYEFFYDVSEKEEESVKFAVKVNGEFISRLSLLTDGSINYKKLGEFEFRRKGEYAISVFYFNYRAQNQKRLKFYLVSKSKREVTENQLIQILSSSDTALSYLFTKNKGKFIVTE